MSSTNQWACHRKHVLINYFNPCFKLSESSANARLAPFPGSSPSLLLANLNYRLLQKYHLSPTKDFELAWEGVHDYGCSKLQISQENLLDCTRVMVSQEICLHSYLYGNIWKDRTTPNMA